jgi:hypothetical protein
MFKFGELMRIAFMLSLILGVAGCMSLTPESRIPLLADELSILNSHKDILISKDGALKGAGQKFASGVAKDEYGFYIGSFRDRLLKYSKSLKLTPDEVKKLKGAGDVELCGKCGNLKGVPTCCSAGAKASSFTEYAKNSLIDRILGY